MKTLVKKDILSIALPIRNAIIATVVFWIIIYLLTINLFIHAEILLFPILLMVAFISYDLVVQIFRLEHNEKIYERVSQFPIPMKDLIFSRFISSFTIVLVCFIIYFLLFSLNLLAHGESIFTPLHYIHHFSIVLHLVVFTLSCFFVVSFTYGFSKGIWAGRLAFVTWIFFFYIAPLMYWSYTLNVSEAPIQSYIQMISSPVLFLSAFVLLLLTYSLCLRGYGRKRLGNKRVTPVAIMVLASLIMFISIGLQTENRTSSDIEAKILETEIERVVIDPINMNSPDEEGLYRILFNIELKGKKLDWEIMNDITVMFHVNGAAKEFTHLEKGSFLLMSANHSFLRKEPEKENHVWFAYQEEGPVLLSEEELIAFQQQFNERDFQIVLQTPWIEDKELELNWSH